MATGNEIRKVTLELWDKDWCGTDKGPAFQIRTRDGTTRTTYLSFDPALKGNTLQWDHSNEKLGSVNGLKLPCLYINGRYRYVPCESPNKNDYIDDQLIPDRKGYANYLQFKLIGQSGDDFCPKRFKVVTYDGTVYLQQMNDWVDKRKGYETRRAYQLTKSLIHEGLINLFYAD